MRQLNFTVTHLLDLTASRGRGAGTSRAPAAWCSTTCSASRTPAPPRAPTRSWCASGRASWATSRWFRGREPRRRAALSHERVPVHRRASRGGRPRRRSQRRDRARVLGRLHASGREVIEIGHGELEHFAGNMLELGTWDEALGDARVLVMSESARRALEPGDVRAALGLHRHGARGAGPDNRDGSAAGACAACSRKCSADRDRAPPQGGSAYLWGRSSGAWSSAGLGGVDIRRSGSGNAGATNALRTQGKSGGISVLVIDLAKGWLATAMIAHLTSAADPAGGAGAGRRGACRCAGSR